MLEDYLLTGGLGDNMYDEALQQLIQLNFIPISLILFLIVFLVINDSYEHWLTLYFIPPLVGTTLLVIIDNIDYYFFNITDRGILHRLIAILGYNCRIVIMLSLIYIALRNIKNPKKHLLIIPAIINFFITILALFTDLVFSYGESGEIIRGPLAYTPHITCILYCIFLFGYAVYITKNGRNSEAIIIFMTVSLTLLGVLVEAMNQLRGILIGVISMNISFYYLYIHIEHYKVDEMTGAMNRKSFFAAVRHLNQKDGVDLISIDLNDLKKINDTFGHLTGDEAIRSIVNIVKLTFRKYNGKYQIYRLGGDEFMVICKGMEEEDIQNFMGRLDENMSRSKYTFSAGHIRWEPNETFDQAYARADKAMYKVKQAYHNLNS